MNPTKYRSVELPTRSKFVVSSNTWPIMDFSSINFDGVSYAEPGTNQARDGLRSPVQRYSVIQQNEHKKCAIFHAWLWLDYVFDEELHDHPVRSGWLSLALTTSFDYCHKPEEDSRNRCYAWIVGTGGKKKCMSMLPGGVHSSDASEYTFRKMDFVLYDDVVNRDKGLLKDDQLTIVFEMRALTNEFSIVDSWLFHPLESEVTHDTEHTLTKDLKLKLDSGQGSDVTLVANDGQEFPAHVWMLASRSPVFATMFEVDMIEKRERRVKIEDMNSQAVRSLLDFIYTDAVSEASLLEDEQLFFAADKYSIPRLKISCEEAMVASLKVENAAERLSIGHVYDADKLHRAAKYFTVRHLHEVKETQGWKNLQDHSPHLVMEIVDELADIVPQLMSSK